MKTHPAANIFPMMSVEELDGLIDDIKANGLRQPIVTHDGMILDGRNRHHACEEAGVAPRFEEWDGASGSPTAYVLSLNLHRRHLSTSQRSIVGAYAEKLFAEEAKERQRASGGDKKSVDARSVVANLPPAIDHAKAREQAAAQVNVSPRSIQAAKRVIESAPELVEAVQSGALKLDAAAQLADLPKQTREKLAADPKAAQRAASAVRASKKGQRPADKIAEKPKSKAKPSSGSWDPKQEVALLRAFVRQSLDRWKGDRDEFAKILERLAEEVRSAHAA